MGSIANVVHRERRDKSRFVGQGALPKLKDIWVLRVQRLLACRAQLKAVAKLGMGRSRKRRNGAHDHFKAMPAQRSRSRLAAKDQCERQVRCTTGSEYRADVSGRKAIESTGAHVYQGRCLGEFTHRQYQHLATSGFRRTLQASRCADAQLVYRRTDRFKRERCRVCLEEANLWVMGLAGIRNQSGLDGEHAQKERAAIVLGEADVQHVVSDGR